MARQAVPDGAQSGAPCVNAPREGSHSRMGPLTLKMEGFRD